MAFRTLKKALEKFCEHESSLVHKEAALKLMAIRSASGGIDAQLQCNQVHHRRMLTKLISCIKYLARQGLAYRGHHEDVDSCDGNFYQLLLLQAEDCSDMKAWLQKREYAYLLKL